MQSKKYKLKQEAPVESRAGRSQWVDEIFFLLPILCLAPSIHSYIVAVARGVVGCGAAQLGLTIRENRELTCYRAIYFSRGK